MSDLQSSEVPPDVEEQSEALDPLTFAQQLDRAQEAACMSYAIRALEGDIPRLQLEIAEKRNELGALLRDRRERESEDMRLLGLLENDPSLGIKEVTLQGIVSYLETQGFKVIHCFEGGFTEEEGKRVQVSPSITLQKVDMQLVLTRTDKPTRARPDFLHLNSEFHNASLIMMVKHGDEDEQEFGFYNPDRVRIMTLIMGGFTRDAHLASSKAPANVKELQERLQIIVLERDVAEGS